MTDQRVPATLVLSVLFAAIFLTFTVFGMLAPLLVELAAEFQTSVAVAGQLAAATSIAWAIAAPLVGPWSDTYGRRLVVLTGLMLMALGVTIAKLRVRSIQRSVALSALRLGLGFALGVAMAELFGLTGISRGVLILQSAMPVAVMNFLCASRYQCEPEEVAGMIVASTALSFLTLPALLYVVL